MSDAVDKALAAKHRAEVWKLRAETLSALALTMMFGAGAWLLWRLAEKLAAFDW